MSTLICVTSYLKNEALRVFINSLIKYDYLSAGNTLLICDDGNSHAREVYEEFLPILSHRIDYLTHPRGGVWKNKNSGIQFFLEKTNHDFMWSADDDIELIQSGLLDQLIAAMENSKIGHITTFLSDFSCSLDGNKNGFFSEFPVILENETTAWTKGCQGIGIMYKRETLEKVGYFDHCPGKYAFEHSLHSARINKLEGKFPELFPLFKKSGKYIKTQLIPNEYHDHQEGIDLNRPFYYNRLREVYNGHNLKINIPWEEIKKKKKK